MQPSVSVAPDGTITGVDGTRYRLLHVPGLMLDARTLPEQDHYSYLLGTLAASLPHKARLSIFIENRPADPDALAAQLRAQVAPQAYTKALGELGDVVIDWWTQRLSKSDNCLSKSTPRHVPALDYWLLVSPYPVQDGYPEQSPEARLGQAVEALTRQLVAMGLPPTVADESGARAVLGRHLVSLEGGNIATFQAPAGDESLLAYRTDRGWVRTLYLVAPPAFTEPGWLRSLVAPDCPATLVLHLCGLKRSRERRRQAWRLRLMEGTAAKGKDVGTAIAAGEAEEQATALHTTGYGIVKVGCYVRLEGDTRAQLDQRVGRVLQTMRDSLLAEPGFGHAHQEPLYRATLPGYGDPARSTYRWDSTTVGNSFPFLAFNPGTRTAGIPLGTTDAAGDVVTLALDDPDLYNRIGVVLGRVGTGKTSLLQKLALGFLLRGDMATVVSSVDSFAPLCAISGGSRAVLGGPASTTINVFDGPCATDEDRAERVRYVCAAVDLLLGGLQGLEPAFLDDAVRDVYAADTATDPDGQRPPVMSDLYDALEARWTAPGCDPDDRKVYRALGWRLRPYVKDGQHARLVDGLTTVDLAAPILAFNTEPLEENATLRNFAYFSVFAIVDQRRALARKKSAAAGRSSADHLTGLDEAWGLLTSPLARDYINRDARKARHGGNCVVFASQQIKDLVGVADAETFFTQASFKALFSIEDNGQQTEGNPRLWLERMLNLTPEEVEAAQRMAGVKGQYMPCFLTRRDRRSPRDLHGVVRVELAPEEAILYASDPDDVRVRDWWTERCGGDVWAGIKAAIDGAAEAVSA